MSQNALSGNLWAGIFVCKASAFLRMFSSCPPLGKTIIPVLAGERDFGKAPKAARNLHHALNTSTKQILNVQLLSLVPSHCPVHEDADVLHLFLRDTCPHCDSPSITDPAGWPLSLHFPASILPPPLLVWAALSRLLHQTKTRKNWSSCPGRGFQGPATDGQSKGDRCESAAGVWKDLPRKKRGIRPLPPPWKHTLFASLSL